jgi:hypothetical protein
MQPEIIFEWMATPSKFYILHIQSIRHDGFVQEICVIGVHARLVRTALQNRKAEGQHADCLAVLGHPRRCLLVSHRGPALDL